MRLVVDQLVLVGHVLVSTLEVSHVDGSCLVLFSERLRSRGLGCVWAELHVLDCGSLGLLLLPQIVRVAQILVLLV